MMYTLAAKDLWPEAKDIVVEFLFVKFPKSPVQQVKISEEQQDSSEFDAIVVGAGPAGMSAALCLSRAQLSVMLIDRNLPGGETATAYNITNYLGFPDGIFGSELSENMEKHLELLSQ